MATQALHLTRSLEDYRAELLLEVSEFVKSLQVTVQTYQRLLKQPDSVRFKTKRLMLDRLRELVPGGASLTSYHIHEFAPVASAAVVAQLHAIIEQADQEGWFVYDPDTLQPTGALRDGAGNSIPGRTHD